MAQYGRVPHIMRDNVKSAKRVKRGNMKRDNVMRITIRMSIDNKSITCTHSGTSWRRAFFINQSINQLRNHHGYHT
jgi:hypothetical protein